MLAALKSYGFVAYEGSAKDRKAIFTDDARTYLRAQQEQIKREVIQRAALKPRLFRQFWEIWGADRVPDEVRLDELVLKHGFADSAAKTFLKVYDDTIAFAKLAPNNGDILSAYEYDEAEMPSMPAFQVGDIVQVQIDNVLQLPKPARIRSVQEYNGEQWVFLEGTRTGFPASQVILELSNNQMVPQENSAPPMSTARDIGESVPEGWEEEQLIDDGGGEIRIRYKGRPSIERYEYIRDYLDFKIARLKKAKLT